MLHVGILSLFVGILLLVIPAKHLILLGIGAPQSVAIIVLLSLPMESKKGIACLMILPQMLALFIT